MTPSSSDAGNEPPPSATDDGVVNPWLVRLFLVLAFGLAFGIEGMTLIRSYVLDGDEGGQTEQVQAAPPPHSFTVQVGDDLLPDLPVEERIERMGLQAQEGGPWTFRLEVAVHNDTEGTYRLSVRDVGMEDGAFAEASHSVECAPGDSARLVATWSVAADARPHSLTAVAELHLPNDSTASTGRRVQLGHVPVQMER